MNVVYKTAFYLCIRDAQKLTSRTTGYEKRLNSKFKNPPCRECKILPICGGGCTQNALEHVGIDYCVYNFDEEAKLREIKKLFFQNIK